MWYLVRYIQSSYYGDQWLLHQLGRHFIVLQDQHGGQPPTQRMLGDPCYIKEMFILSDNLSMNVVISLLDLLYSMVKGTQRIDLRSWIFSIPIEHLEISINGTYCWPYRPPFTCSLRYYVSKWRIRRVSWCWWNSPNLEMFWTGYFKKEKFMSQVNEL